MLKHFTLRSSMQEKSKFDHISQIQRSRFRRAGIVLVLLMAGNAEAQDSQGCAAGQFGANGTCTLCSAGLFSSGNSTECVACLAGTFSRGGSSECTDCAAGRYDHDSSATTPCEPCPLHSYSESTGTVGDCTPCPSEKGTAAVGADASSLCNETAVRYPCTDFTCAEGQVRLTAASVGFPDPADEYCAGEACDFVDDLARRMPDIRFRLEIAAGLPEPDEATALTLFRIVQEGTTNVLRHAGARQVAIRLWTDPAHWRMILTDDGVGLGPDHREGTGLTGMRERITLLGGTLCIGAEGRGTQLQASLPRPTTS